MQHFTKLLVFLYEGGRAYNLLQSISMLRHIRLKHALLTTAAVTITMITLAWPGGGTYQANKQLNKRDTIPSKDHSYPPAREKACDEDVDRGLRELDRAMNRISDKVENIDWKKINEQVERAVRDANKEIAKEVDFEKIKKETARAMQHAGENIDLKEIETDIERSMEKVNEELRSEQFHKSIQEVNKKIEKVKKELKVIVK